MNSVEQRLARIASEKLAARKTGLITALICVVIMACVVMFSIWHTNRRNTVTATEDAGALIDATFSDGLAHDTTTVRTSRGTFKVHGTFQTTSGHSTEIRSYQNGDRRLCDLAADTCKTLVQ